MSTEAKQALLEQLLDLAHHVASRLRHHAQPMVRVSAALLLAASIAACGGSPATDAPVQPPATQVAPLAQEVRTGLPTQPGRYAVVAGSILRDAQGVYQLSWTGTDGASGTARVSSLKLNQSDKEELEIPEQGDPILHLGPQTPVRIVESSTAGEQRERSGGGVSFIPALWFPFGGGGFFGGGPSYYDPPRTVPSGSTVEGGRRYTVPQPLGERTVGLGGAVSGRAGGTGAGTAATSKSGATFGGKSGAADAVGAAPKSGSFSAGRPATGGTGLSGG